MRNRTHKARRESNDRETIEKLRGKNRQLIKEVQKLRRLVSADRHLPGTEDEQDAQNIRVRDDSPTEGFYSCPKCGQSVTNTIELRGFIYIFCSNCDYKGKL